jgi:hypothetical protein
MTLSETIKELYVSSGNDVILHTLAINHTTFTSPYYIVQNNENYVANLENSGPQVTFQKYSFNIVGPHVNANANQYLKINIDAVNLTLINLLEGCAADENNNPIEVTYRVYLASDTTEPQAEPVTLYLKNVSVNNFTISANAEFKNLNNLKFPSRKYDSTFQNLVISK